MKEKLMNYIHEHKKFVTLAAIAVVAICVLTGVLIALLLSGGVFSGTPTPTDNDGLVYNGSFEINDGMSADGWYAYKGKKKSDWGDFNNYISLSTERAHSGQYSARVSLTTLDMPGKNPWVSYHLPVEPGVTYKVSVWVYIEELLTDLSDTDCYARIKCEQYADAYSFTSETALSDFSVSSEPQYLVGEWFLLEEEFSSTIECKGLAFFLRLMGYGTVYYDDFSVEKITETKKLILETDGSVYYTDAIENAGKIGTATLIQNSAVDYSGMSIAFKLLDGEDVVLSQDKQPAEDGVTFQYSLDLLKKKDYRYIVEATLYNADGSVAEVETMPLFKYDRSPYVREDGTYMLDQDGDGVKEPFYPIFAYHAGAQRYMPYLKEIGVNAVQVTYTSMDELDARMKELEENNVMGMISLYNGMVMAGHPDQRAFNTQVLNKYKDHPNVLCWLIMDEPFSHYAYFDCIDLLADSYEFIRSIDKDDPNPIYIMDNTSGTFRWTSMYSDIIGTDPYPSSKRDRATFVHEYITKLKEAADAQGGRAVWSLVQACNLGFFPNNHELRSSIYQSYFAGADAIGYYSIGDPISVNGQKLPLYQTDLWPAVREYYLVDKEMIDDVFLTGELETFNEERFADYWYKSWWKDGKLYLLLLNRDMDTSRYVRFKLQSADGTQQVGAYKATVIAGGLDYVEGNGTFTAILPACGAQLWEIRTGDTYNDPDPEPRLIVDTEPTGNLLHNSDFSSKSSGWSSNASWDLNEISDTVFHGESGYSVKLIADPVKMTWESKYNNPWVAQTVDTVVGKTYKITAWVNVETLTEGSYVIMRTYDSDTKKFSSTDPLIRKVTDGWVQIEHTFVATCKRTGIHIRCMDKVGGSIVYVDDVVVEKIVLDEASDNLILKNGDFESLNDGWSWNPTQKFHQNPSAQNWGVTGAWTDDCVTIMYNKSIGSSLKLDNDGTLPRILARQQVTLEAGKQYTLLGRIRVQDVEEGAAGYELTGVKGVKWQVSEECRWTDFKQTFVVSNEDNLNPILNLYMDGVGICYFDDLWLVEGDGSVLPGDVDPTKPVEVAVNGGFEANFKSWTANKYGQISQDIFYAGTQSAMIKNDGTLSQPWIYQLVKMEDGMTYTVSVRFRYGEMALGDAAQMRIRLRDGNKEYIKTYQVNPEYTPKEGEWGIIEYTFTAPEGAKDAIIYLRLTGKNVVSTCYFDEFSVVKYIRDNNSAADNDPDNLSVNGGFENDLKSWNSKYGAVDTKVSCTGSNSVSIINDGTLSQPWISQTVPLTAGKTYEFSVRYKGEFAPEDNAELRIRLRNADKEYIKTYQIKPTGVQSDGEWGTISYVFTAPEGTVDALTYLRLTGKNVNSKVWFDDFIVKLTDKKPTDSTQTPETTDDPTNLASNGSFEESKSWQMNSDYSAYSSDAFVTGTRSGKVFNDGTRSQPWMSQTIALEAGKNYKVTVRYKGTFAEGDDAQIRIRLRNEAGEYIANYFAAPTTVQTGSEWGTIEYVFTAPEGTVNGLFYLRMTAKDVVSECYFDDFAVRVTDETPEQPEEEPTVPVDPTNLASNGSFEESKSWQMNSDYSAYSSDAFVTGTHSGKVFNDGTRSQPWMSQTIALEAGKNYKVTVRYKGTFAEGDDAQIRIRLRNADGEYIAHHLASPTTLQTASEWGTIEYVFTAPEGTANGLFYLRMTGASVVSECYFDDFAVRVTDETPEQPEEEPTAPVDPTNLASNGSFEESKSWQMNSDYSAYSSDAFVTGTRSGKVFNDGTRSQPWMSQTIALEAGKNYKVTVRYKGTFAEGDDAQIRIRLRNEAGEYIANYFAAPTTVQTGSEWGTIEYVFTAPEGTVNGLFYLRMTAKEVVSECYFDDFAVRVTDETPMQPDEEPVGPTNLATNGSFEEGSSWQMNSARAAYSTDVFLTGARSAKVFNDGTQSQPWISQAIDLEAGKNYKVTVRYRGAFAEGDDAQIRIRLRNEAGEYIANYFAAPTTVQTGSEWGTIEYVFTAPEGTVNGLFYLRMIGANVVSECYFDDFGVYEVETAG